MFFFVPILLMNIKSKCNWKHISNLLLQKMKNNLSINNYKQDSRSQTYQTCRFFFGRCLCRACSREIHQSLTDPELPAERIRDLCRHQGWEEGESTGVEHDRRGAH